MAQGAVAASIQAISLSTAPLASKLTQALST
jgi:hypothetical protein